MLRHPIWAKYFLAKVNIEASHSHLRRIVMRVTNYMINKWAKAALLVLFGIILLLYWEKVMNEMMPEFERLIEGDATFLQGLLNAIGWVLIFWCFLDAALNMLMSFRESKVSLEDLGSKLDDIDKTLSERLSPFPARKPAVVAQKGIGRMTEEKPKTDRLKDDQIKTDEEKTDETITEKSKPDKALSPPLPPPPP